MRGYISALGSDLDFAIYWVYGLGQITSLCLIF